MESDHPDFMGWITCRPVTPYHDDPGGGVEKHALVYLCPQGNVAVTFYEMCYCLWSRGESVGGRLWKKGEYIMDKESRDFIWSIRRERV